MIFHIVGVLIDAVWI